MRNKLVLLTATCLLSCSPKITNEYLLNTEYLGNARNGAISFVFLETDKIYYGRKKVEYRANESDLRTNYHNDIYYLGGFIFKGRSNKVVYIIGEYGIENGKNFVSIKHIDNEWLTLYT